jgi:hypothetical protein
MCAHCRGKRTGPPEVAAVLQAGQVLKILKARDVVRRLDGVPLHLECSTELYDVA